MFKLQQAYRNTISSSCRNFNADYILIVSQVEFGWPSGEHPSNFHNVSCSKAIFLALRVAGHISCARNVANLGGRSNRSNWSDGQAIPLRSWSPLLTPCFRSHEFCLGHTLLIARAPFPNMNARFFWRDNDGWCCCFFQTWCKDNFRYIFHQSCLVGDDKWPGNPMMSEFVGIHRFWYSFLFHRQHGEFFSQHKSKSLRPNGFLFCLVETATQKNMLQTLPNLLDFWTQQLQRPGGKQWKMDFGIQRSSNLAHVEPRNPWLRSPKSAAPGPPAIYEPRAAKKAVPRVISTAKWECQRNVTKG